MQCRFRREKTREAGFGWTDDDAVLVTFSVTEARGPACRKN